MTCRELAAQLVAYLDGDLDGDHAADCRGHLRVCAACRRAADEHARVRDALVELPRVEPPTALWSQINARLGAEEIAASARPAWQRAWQRFSTRWRPLAWPVAMTTSACAIALVVVKLRAPTPPSAVAPVAAVTTPTPSVPEADPAPVQIALRDAIEEAGDRDRDADARFRTVAGELLVLARAEVATWPRARATRFTHEVEAREHAVLTAAVGRDRDRAWHELTSYLERVALDTQVASR